MPAQPETQMPSAGYRLQRLEVLNWGTFDKHIWEISPNGQNALLTGDIGSGKSTLVDAITTLLVPQQKITYNKAAGAESRERNLLSYVRGAYKNEKVNTASKGRDVYLRPDNKHLTLLLAVFANAAQDAFATLAQVYWMQDDSVKRFYLLSEEALQIDPDFSNFGTDIRQLKKQLRKQRGAELFNSFSAYADRFRQVFGIRQPEALDLFYQTVSMKSVGNLTEFVREQMLGQTNIQEDINELVAKYADLTMAHRLVAQARQQRDLLQPMIEEADEREKVLEQIHRLEALLDELPGYFAKAKLQAAIRSMDRLKQDWETLEAEILDLQQQEQQSREELARLKAARDNLSVNQQLAQIKLKIKEQSAESERRRAQARKYEDQLTELGQFLAGSHGISLSMPTAVAGFVEQQHRFVAQQEQALAQLEELQEARDPLAVRIDKHRARLEELDKELHSLRQRPTQIPQRNLKLRQKLLTGLNLTEEDLPFAGELLQVLPEEAHWEGAIERQLRGFGLSLLVPDQHYEAVSNFLDRNHLGGKLVYLRTLPHRGSQNSEPDANSLVRKVQIKTDTPFYEWLEMELANRYDYTCCNTMAEFRRAARALTPGGQSKDSRVRHTKDDRYDVNDRRQYILGWSNKPKIKALEEEQREVQGELSGAQAEQKVLRNTERALDEQRRILERLLECPSFESLDFKPLVIRIAQLQEEQQRLESGSEELRDLQAKIVEAEALERKLRAQVGKQYERKGVQKDTLSKLLGLITAFLQQTGLPPLPISAVGKEVTNEVAGSVFNACKEITIPEPEPSAQLRKHLPDLSGAEPAEALAKTEQQLRDKIEGNKGMIRKFRDQESRLAQRIVQKMTTFKQQFPEEVVDVDADIRSVGEFRERYERLQKDDIPRHEERFRELLRTKTIQSILMFKSKLDNFEQDINRKINEINQHLREIDYNPGRYISISKEQVHSEDITTFKQDLRACLSNTYGDVADEELYTEEKFEHVKRLLDRFGGHTEEDSRWTKKVTDVRQWYTFGAEERYRETNELHEYFSDSSGKSGGQKEKLAYTILASAIAFQFGLEWGRSRSRSFRFVVIDEAFGRGSDESTRYGLQLFERLNLQLLIVTPLQKINVIEKHISTVHYVSNPTGQSSMVRNISIAEYQAEKAAREKAVNTSKS
ncbi:MAG: ATP-binding protein [Phaeodactylibacter sp.]|uniref:ATP-binding protein n=1 Tax=Phaeodactylibacter sp. TaxID=1940289 RepID=UPI0032EFA791